MSTARGWVAAMASATLLGSRPPARTKGRPTPETSDQSKRWPVPCPLSSRMTSAPEAWARETSSALRTRKAWITGASGTPAAASSARSRARYASSSWPCSWQASMAPAATSAATEAGSSSTKTPTRTMAGSTPADSTGRSAAGTLRWDLGKSTTKPTKSGAAALAAATSSGRCSPHSLTSVPWCCRVSRSRAAAILAALIAGPAGRPAWPACRPPA